MENKPYAFHAIRKVSVILVNLDIQIFRLDRKWTELAIYCLLALRRMSYFRGEIRYLDISLDFLKIQINIFWCEVEDFLQPIRLEFDTVLRAVPRDFFVNI